MIVLARPDAAPNIADGDVAHRPRFLCGRLDAGHFAHLAALLTGRSPTDGASGEQIRILCSRTRAAQTVHVYELTAELLQGLREMDERRVAELASAWAGAPYAAPARDRQDYFEDVLRQLGALSLKAVQLQITMLVRVEYEDTSAPAR